MPHILAVFQKSPATPAGVTISNGLHLPRFRSEKLRSYWTKLKKYYGLDLPAGVKAFLPAGERIIPKTHPFALLLASPAPYILLL